MKQNTDKHVALTMFLSILDEVERCIANSDMPSLRSDAHELFKRVDHRGPSILLEDLPKVGKIFDKGLSEGHFYWEKIPNNLRRKGGWLFESILLWSFDKSGSSRDPNVETVTLTRQILYAFKKVEMDSTDKAKRDAISEFFEIEHQLAEPSLDWNSDCFIDNLSQAHGLSFYDLWAGGEQSLRLALSNLDIVSKLLVFGEFHLDWDDCRPKHGPGSVSDMPGGGDKYSFPSWPKRLSVLFPANGWASHVHDSAEESLTDYWGEDPRSKLICVPKTLNKPRVIASEPTANMYIQQAVMKRLKRSLTKLALNVVSFSDQTPSQEDARSGSLTGDTVTIDLSSASDRLSLKVVERFYSTPWLEAFWACRTPSVYDPLTGQEVLMKKFAPQGSAVTFPVQTLVYAGAAISAALASRGIWARDVTLKDLLLLIEEGDFEIRVFGDDIIVPKFAADVTVSLLESLGLKVNADKTHTNGFFRESCGMDAYRGKEVTPLYFTSISKPSSFAQLVSWTEVRNNAYRKGFWGIASVMEELIPQGLRQYVYKSPSPAGGVRLETFLPVSNRPLKRRWNEELQVLEYKTVVPKEKQEVERRHDWSDLLQYFIEAAEYDSLSYLDPALNKVGAQTDCRVVFTTRWVRI